MKIVEKKYCDAAWKVIYTVSAELWVRLGYPDEGGAIIS